MSSQNANITRAKMLEILSASVSGTPTGVSYSDSWDDILTELEGQTVSCIPGLIIDSLGLTEKQLDSYEDIVAVNFRECYKLMKVQDRIVRALEDNSVSVVVLKGSAAAMNCPVYDLRSMGDIDIIVPPELFDRAEALLPSIGLTKVELPWKEGERHKSYRMGEFEIELHKFFSTSNNKDCNDILDNIVYDGARHAQHVTLGDFSVPVLPKKANGLVLLSHVNQHLSTGLGLRQIMDWLFFVKNNLDDKFWDEEFASAAESVGLKTLAINVTAMCQKYLGLDKSLSWCRTGDESIIDELMDYILERGNFGRNLDYSSKATTDIAVKFRTPSQAFQYLQKEGKAKWKAVDRHPWLEPFAWTYQIGHIIYRIFERNVRISDFFKGRRAARKKLKMMEKLGVTRY